ncbi:MAG TPA: BolA family protein, partial [Acidocella sp.]|nr:BolA family protein [Acidocella sp.]
MATVLTGWDEVNMTTRYERMFETLTASFQPVQLEIVDDSGKHASHSHRTNAPQGGETHYKVTMVAAAFAGKSRLERSRAVNAALDAEFKTGLHALSLKLSTP